MPCIFCEIAVGKQPANVIYETGVAVAFLDNHPLVDGHTMVIPRDHYQRLADMPEDLVRDVFAAVREVARKVEAALGNSAATIGINDGPEAGQVVPHLHVHIIPRTAGDGGGNIHSIVRRPTRVPLADMQARIRGAG